MQYLHNFQRRINAPVNNFRLLGVGIAMHASLSPSGLWTANHPFAPDGKKIADVNSTRSIEGSEALSAIAEVTGAYLIEVRSSVKAAKTGRYGIKPLSGRLSGRCSIRTDCYWFT
jgi:hypothetical protein